MEKTMAEEKLSGQQEPCIARCAADWQSVLPGLKLTPVDGQEIDCAKSCPVVMALIKKVIRSEAQLAQLKQMHFGQSSEKGATVLGGANETGTASDKEDTSSPATPSESDQAAGGKAEDQPQGQNSRERGDKQDDDNTSETAEETEPRKNGRGAKPGHKGHGRRIPKNLVEEEFFIRVSDEQRFCPITGEEGKSLPLSFWEKSTQIDIRLIAVRQVFYREKLKFDCCDGCPGEMRAQCPVALAGRAYAASSSDEDVSVPTTPETAKTVDNDTCPVPDAEPLQTINDSETAPGQATADTTTGMMHQAGPKTIFVTAPQPPQAVDKSKLTTGTLAFLMYLKYFLALPLTRISTLLATACGLRVGPSSMTCTFEHHKDLLKALYDKMAEEVRKFDHINIDETRWMSFFHRVGKANYMDWMWVMASEKVVMYVLDTSRSSKVLFKWLGDTVAGVITADRAHAYKKFAKNVAGALLSFCWAHFRRDFVKAAVGNAHLRDWAKRWIGRIHRIYRLNRERIKVLGDSKAFPKAQAKLEAAVKEFLDQIKAELSDPNLYAAQREVLESAVRHWDGLTIFVTDPLVPLDNNRAERLLRIVALGRKNYYGTYAEWSGLFTAYSLTIIQTNIMHGLEPMAYIQYYLDVCAKAGGVPKDLEAHLPWNIPPHIRQQYGMSQKEEKQCA